MTRLAASLTLFALLAACGADGPPLPPSKANTPGITLSGEARIGVAGSL